MATADTPANLMVDCTPGPLMEPPTKLEELEEATSRTESTSCDTTSQEGQTSSESEPEAGLGEDNEVESSNDSESERDDPVADNLPMEEGERKQASAESMALNDAFMALENMRKANLEVEFGGKSIPNIDLFHQYCTTCLQSQKRKEDKNLKRQESNPNKNPNAEKGRKMLKQVIARLRTKKKSPPCLICTRPVCSKHCCQDFKKEKITICGQCAPLFTMDFVVATISNDTEEEKRRQCIAHMIDSYDRALLMLKYSAQFIDEIAEALEERSKTNDHIGLGSSGVGLMSGFTGVTAVVAQFVAAAAILSPAGPPLVIASIFFGASAAAASTGTEAVNFYSEPNQLACKIIALYDMVHSLVGVTSVLKDAIERGHIDARHFTEMKPDKKRSTYWKTRVPEKPKKEVVVEDVVEEGDETVDGIEASDGSVTSTEEKPTVEKKSLTKDVVPTQEKESEPSEKVPSLADIDTDGEESVNASEEQEQEKTSSINDIDGDDEETSQAQQQPEKKTSSLADIDTDGDESVKEGVSQDGQADGGDTSESQVSCDQQTAEPSTTQFVMVSSDVSKGKSEDKVVEQSGGKTSTDVVAVAPSNVRTAASRTLTNSLKLAAFASIACCVLSAATIVMETKNMRDTLESMRKGSPCEKAALIRKIRDQIDDLPDTKEIAEGCEAYLRSTEK